MSTVAVYFVASPLQYLAARQIAQRFEAQAQRQVLVWYKPGLAPLVRAEDWDAAAYMPWPRWEPLPGPFGAHRRLCANLREVAALVGRCDTLHLHSAVFDTEAINYFLRGLPAACGATTMRARLLPDGIISIRRYPLSRVKRLAQYARKLRRLVTPALDYWCFSGDRTGADAPFCDRIYVLPGLPHEYQADRVVTLAPLASRHGQAEAAPQVPRALVVGQPLAGAGLLDEADLPGLSAEIRQWLQARGMQQVLYKGHPKDMRRELWQAGYDVVEPGEPLESWMASQRFDIVVGVRSSALLFAKQIYGDQTEVHAFGWDRVKFKSANERSAMEAAFRSCGVLLAPPPAAGPR
ncbi:polysialyltransferase family glycosyltransferase [Eleftheria terrae]|uniref:polysialyltransferase family glycosyltransferase n=1 Tax=Eleftheria terrae TaxID=1597781 RepID=UPI00263AEC46|nr:polysialyltransferase family glycosyltransferase [Eleftheria terrae]WKB54324.1 alpha-2,8-polysialyltransferase family protein [Eleftheria terrae]